MNKRKFGRTDLRVSEVALDVAPLADGKDESVALAVLAPPLVSLLLRGGRFGAESVDLTAGLLVAFAITIPIDSLSYPLSRAIYATHNTIWQVAASLAGLLTLVIASGLLVPALGAAGIAAAYALAGTVKVVGLVAALVVRVNRAGSSG